MIYPNIKGKWEKAPNEQEVLLQLLPCQMQALPHYGGKSTALNSQGRHLLSLASFYFFFIDFVQIKKKILPKIQDIEVILKTLVLWKIHCPVKDILLRLLKLNSQID